MLQGYKTYFIAIIITLALIGNYLGWVPDGIVNEILLFAFPAGLASLKAGQTRIENKL